MAKAQWRGIGVGGRVLAALVCLACGAVLGAAAWVTPATEGHGTHTQLGMTPCLWATQYGAPCPTCGMTTAFARAADGDFWGGLRAQPFGLLLALGAAAGFWGSLHVAATGSRLGEICGKLLVPRVMWSAVALAGAAWAYKFATWPG